MPFLQDLFTTIGPSLAARLKEKAKKQWEKEKKYLETQAKEKVSLPPRPLFDNLPALRQWFERVEIPFTSPIFSPKEAILRIGKAPEISKFPLGKLVTSLLSESEEVKSIRKKLEAGETLTPKERRIAQEETLSVVAGLTGGIKPIKHAASVNIEKLGLTDEGEVKLKTAVNLIKPELEKVKGAPLTHDEVLEAAQKSDILQKVSTRQAQKKAEASLLRTRQLVTDISNKLSQGNKVSPAQWSDYLENIRVISSLATEKGRALESLKIEAEGQPLVERLVSEVMKVTDDTDAVLKAAERVDFTNTKEATKFYRQFVKPSLSEIVDEWRFNSMLSGPRSHLRNAFSNILQTFVTRPATIALEKGPKAAVKYYQGALRGFPQGIDDFTKTMRGETPLLKPDLERIPTRKLPGIMEIPTRAMEGADRFFSAMIREGELARGASAEEAAKVGEYSLFRAGLDITGKEQGPLLKSIDKLTQWLYRMPKGGRYFVPFLRTPINVAKTWLEYSPAGLATIPGASQKKAQLGKAILGSIMTTMGAKLAFEGKTALSSPASETDKKVFYAEGKRPFSVKIGDRWVPMWYAGPFAFSLVLPAIVQKYTEGEEMNKETEEKITGIVGETIKFVAGQTPMAGVNNFVRLLSGDFDRNLIRNLAFTGTQFMPFSGLVRYIAEAVDSTYRKPKGFLDSILADLPVLSKKVEPYTELTGEPARRDITALIAPYTIGKQRPELAELIGIYTKTGELRKEAKKRSEEEKKTAEGVWEEIKDLDRSEQIKRIDQYRKEGMVTKSIYERLRKLKTAEGKGWTEAEKSVYMLGPTEEAEFHYSKIKDWDREKQLKYLNDLIAKGLLTKETAGELKKLKGGK